MACYIHGIGTVSAQQPVAADRMLLQAPLDYVGDKLSCVEPDYTAYFDVRQLRRMSRIIKMGMVAGMDALKESGVKVPDGIITGTGYGCLEDTGVFLTKMIGNHEQALNPTPFIQSTHNTIGSQLALLLQCQGYNQTYTQRALSFEHALIDAGMLLAGQRGQHLLVGSADEITPVSHALLRRFGILRRESAHSLALFTSGNRGTLNGEGAAYFVLSDTPTQGSIKIEAVSTLFKPSSVEIDREIDAVLSVGGISAGEVDVVLSGQCGDEQFDNGMHAAISGRFSEAMLAAFKHLTGEFPTASALALAMAARFMQAEDVPNVMVTRHAERTPKRVLIYNRYLGIYHSLILLSTR